MKIWCQHGSEHSANLVMIGHFKDETGANRVKAIIDELTRQVREEESKGTLTIGDPPERYSKTMLDFLLKLNIGAIGPGELEQFAYDVNVTLEGKDLVLTTDEYDVSAFLKVMFLEGARIEVYSAHYHPEGEYGRRRR